MLSVFAVDSLADVVAADGLITLREALQAANTNTAVCDAPAGSAAETDKIIIFAQDPADPGNSRITLSGQQLDILGDVEIYGPGPDRLSIDANQQSRVFSIAADVEASLWGLTITGGFGGDYPADAGGIYSAGMLTVTESIVSDNSIANWGGAAIYNDAGTLFVINSRFSGNSGSSQGGGVLVGSGGDMTIVDSIIADNACGGGGVEHGTLTVTGSIIASNGNSGIGVSYGTGTISNCNISNNKGSGTGAYSGQLTITGSTISNNTSAGVHGEREATITIVGSTISGNASSGVVAEYYSTTVVLDSTISGNGSCCGGGIYSRDSKLTVSNSTISGNAAGMTGGGICMDGGGVVTITGSTLANNSAAYGGGIAKTYLSSGGTISISHSTVSGNAASSNSGGIYGYVSLYNSVIAGNDAPTYPDVYRNTLAESYVGGTHNLIGVWDGKMPPGRHNLFGTPAAPLDPMLGPLQDNGGSTLTMAPLPGSPLIDAGDGNVMRDQYGFVMLTDQRGSSRLYGDADIGAVEFQPGGVPVAYGDVAVIDQGQIIALDVLANDIHDEGATIETAIVGGPAHGTIERNADGTLTYTPEATFSGTDTFTYQAVNGELASNVAEVALSVLSPASILVTTTEDGRDGDLSAGDISLREAIDLASPGAMIQFAASMVGEVITIGNADGPLDVSDVRIVGPGAEHLRIDGARKCALFAVGGDTRISRLTLSGSGKNSGIVVHAGAVLDLDDVHVADNGLEDTDPPYRIVAAQGGGIFVERGSTLILERSVVWGNTSQSGGGVYSGGVVTMTDSTVSGNYSYLKGGIWIDTFGTLNVVDSNISNNTSGGIYNLGVVNIADSAITRNAGCSVYNQGVLTVVDSTVSGNTTAIYGGGIYNSQGTLDVIRSTISDNWGRGIYNGNGVLTMISSTVSHNSGSGIYSDKGRTSIADSIISYNTATNKAGG